jgi:hypothetical protein
VQRIGRTFSPLVLIISQFDQPACAHECTQKTAKKKRPRRVNRTELLARTKNEAPKVTFYAGISGFLQTVKKNSKSACAILWDDYAALSSVREVVTDETEEGKEKVDTLKSPK